MEDFKDLPIIAMTAHSMMGDREKAMTSGMNEHVSKPIDMNQLERVLMRFLGEGIDGKGVVQNKDAAIGVATDSYGGKSESREADRRRQCRQAITELAGQKPCLV